MQKIDIKLILIIILLALNVYQSISNYKPKNQIDVSNVFLKDKIESLNRDVNTIFLKLKLLDNIQVKLDNLKQDIEDLNTKINNNLSK